jgi:hypothetical protein
MKRYEWKMGRGNTTGAMSEKIIELRPLEKGDNAGKRCEKVWN